MELAEGTCGIGFNIRKTSLKREDNREWTDLFCLWLGCCL